jgi:hypothetical protein
MSKKLIICALVLILGWSLAQAATHERPMQVRVDLKHPNALETLRNGGYDIMAINKGASAEIIADDADFQRLQTAGLDPVIVHQDLVTFYQSRNPLTATMGGFRTFSECIAYMDSLHAQYPNLTTARDSIGYTYQGRAIWMMKISDNPDIDEDEPEIMINGLIHAREPMGMESTIRYMAYLLENYGVNDTITDWVNSREFYFIPIINADGYEYNRQTNPNGGGMFRKNRHGQGIDLNRNWGYMWGFDNTGSSPYPSDETYRGESAFSEPETQSMREFIISRHFSIAMNFHSAAGLLLYPWGYVDFVTPDNPVFEAIASEATQQNGYSIGPPWLLLYNTNGDANDWQYGEQTEKPKVFAFTEELGTSEDGFWPNIDRIDPIWLDALEVLRVFTAAADNPYSIMPPNAPVLDSIGDVFTSTYTVSWTDSDTLNVPEAYELKEYTGFQRISDDFENPNSYWNLDGFERSTSRHHAGSYSLFSGSDNNYNGLATLNYPTTVAAGDSIIFWTWYSIESGWDYAYVQLSTDGGATYVNLPGNITTNNNPNGQNEGNGITGSSSGWRQGKFPLSNYVGQNVRIRLRYRTDGAQLNEGFYVDEYSPVDCYQNEAVLDSNITENHYVIIDQPEGQYYYQVRARDMQGQWSGFSNLETAIVHPQSVDDNNPLPAEISLSQNYPNPFNPSTQISFRIPVRSRVELVIYNISGAKVRTLVSSAMEAGEYDVVFDGRDGKGQTLSSGNYFYRLKTDNETITRKMTLIK